MTFYLVAGLALVALMALSLFMSRAVWPYHVEGQRGYIRDMLVYSFSPVVPMAVSLILFKVLQSVSPDLAAGYFSFVLMAIGVIGIFIVRRLAPIKAAHARINAARVARWEASS